MEGVRAIDSATNSFFGLLEGTGCVCMCEIGPHNTWRSGGPGDGLAPYLVEQTAWSWLHLLFSGDCTASATRSTGAWEGISYEAPATAAASIACHVPLAKNTHTKMSDVLLPRFMSVQCSF